MFNAFYAVDIIFLNTYFIIFVFLYPYGAFKGDFKTNLMKKVI